MALRLRLLVCGALAFALWSWLHSLHWSLWLIDELFFTLAAALWLGRTFPEPPLISIGIIVALSLRPFFSTAVLLALELPLLGLTLWKLAPWLQARLALPPPPKVPPSTLRLSLTLAVLLVLLFQALRPAWLMVSPDRRHGGLIAVSPKFPIHDPETLSPLAKALRAHVVALSQTVGERSLYMPRSQDKAKDYIVAQFRAAGLEPEVFDYTGLPHGDFVRKQPFHNVEATLGQPGPEGTWIVSAHYDSAPGTPGADDNASGVAVVLELARLLKESPPAAGVRLVAFGTEEPPSFGTTDMGSERCVRELQRRGIKIRGLINLEMLGYYNDNPKSQLFPPFLSLFYPDRGYFLGLVGNLRSAMLTAAVRSSWKKVSPLPLETTILPSVSSTLALSDQLNFWSAGERAVMLTDTAYFRYPHYHQAEDTAEKLDYERMAQAALGVAGVLRDLR